MIKDKPSFNSGYLLEGKYELLFFDGKQNQAELYRARNRQGEVLTVKIFDVNCLDEFCFYGKEIYESHILKHIDIPLIPAYKGSGPLIYKGCKYFYLVKEFAVGDTVASYLEDKSFTTFYDVKNIMKDILSALAYLHNKAEPVIFNNISAQSVIINGRNNTLNAKLNDMSAARYFLDKVPEKLLCGDLRYLPSVAINTNIISKQTDLFGAGVLLYQMLCGFLPWNMSFLSCRDIQGILKERTNRLVIPELQDNFADYDEAADLLIRKALGDSASGQFNTAEEFLQALDNLDLLKNETETKKSAPFVNTPLKPAASGKKGFDAIGGMAELKNLVKRDVLDILHNPQEYKRHHLGLPNGMLLYGPPGCGKTFFAERFAEEAGYNFIKIVASDLASVYVHGTQQKIGEIFKEARQKAPAILYFDEIDAMIPDREDSSRDYQRGEVNEFLSQLDNIGESGVFVIGSTNKPQLIDKAVLRAGRLEKHIYIPPPDLEARKELFRLYLANRPVALGLDYDRLAQLTENYVSADIKYIIDEASRNVIANKLKRINMNILEEVISLTAASIDKNSQEVYKNFGLSGKEPCRRIGFTGD